MLLLGRAEATEPLGHLGIGLLSQLHRLQERLIGAPPATSLTSAAQLVGATVGGHVQVGRASPRARRVSCNHVTCPWSSAAMRRSCTELNTPCARRPG